MIIEDPETFKSWLTTILEPLCDADPAALAKYVFALVKKDKPIPELRASMVEQLDVFLQSETKKFVDCLFKTLETQIYDFPITTTAPTAAVTTTTTVTHVAPVDVTPSVAESSPIKSLAAKQPGDVFLPETLTPVNPPATQPLPTHQVVPSVVPGVNSVQTNGSVSLPLHKRDADLQARTTHRKSDSDKEEKVRPRGRSRHRSSRSPSRGRSRSRSWDRTRRSRSRERDRDRERERARDRERGRAWRNKSPPSRRYERERRRSWSRSNSPPGGPGPITRTRSTGNSRSRSRSPRYNHRGRYRNRSPPGRLSLSHSRSRSNERIRDKKEPLSGAGTPTQDSNHGDVDMRLTTTSQSIQSVVSAGGKTGSDNAVSSGPTVLSGIFHAKRRCRDFDEKGYCMRGDLCPYDHGNDPVVLEDVALTQVLNFNPSHPPNLPLVPPGTGPVAPLNPTPTAQPPAAAEMTEGLPERGATPAVPLEPPPHHMQHPVPHSHIRGPHPVNIVAEYNPDAPSMEPRMVWGRPPFRGGPAGMRAAGMMRGGIGRPVLYNPQPQRELISVPVTDQTQNFSTGFKRNRQTAETNNYTPNNEAKDSSPAKKKSAFDFARLGPRHKNPNNCSLELKKVPRGLNNITHLNNHFSKFGKIVNIQVSFEGDPEAALVTFSSHAEANAAYRSTEAVLNNRFIKVFWHSSSEGKQENVPPPRPSVKERLGVPNPVSSSKVLNAVQPKASVTHQPEAVEKVIMSGNNLTKTVYIPTAQKKQETPVVSTSTAQENSKAQTAAAIKKTQEILAVKETLKKKQEEKRKEALKLTADLRKRKQDLLDKQLAQQKLLIERLEKGGVAPEQRESLMSTIKSLQESIEKIRKDLASAVTGSTTTNSNASKPKLQKVASPVLVKKSKEEAQKEILDAELDLITKQQEGGDTSELQRKVAELKMEAHSLGLLPGNSRVRPHPRGALHLNRSLNRGVSRTVRGTSFRGRARGFSHVSVDHRPTKVLVSGYEEDEKTEVLAHFAQFGEIVDYVVDDSTPSLILNYKSRKEAEVAMLKGRTFQDRLLSITWYNMPGVNRVVRGGHSLMSTVHLHHGLSHRSVIMVGSSTEGEEMVEEAEEGVIEEEEELGVPELGEDVLLQDDEEEEEDGEDRSWRR